MNITYEKYFPKSHIWDECEGVTYICSINDSTVKYDCGITTGRSDQYSGIIVESEEHSDYQSMSLYHGNCLTPFLLRVYKNADGILEHAFKMCYKKSFENGLLKDSISHITDENMHYISPIDFNISTFLENYIGREMIVYFYNRYPIKKTVEIVYRNGKPFHTLYEDDEVDYNKIMYVEIIKE